MLFAWVFHCYIESNALVSAKSSSIAALRLPRPSNPSRNLAICANPDVPDCPASPSDMFDPGELNNDDFA